MSEMNKLGIIIQARTGSSRLPQKMILPFYDGKGILDILLSRLRTAGFEDQIIVATTANGRDDVISEIANHNNVRCYRGDEDDVLMRFIGAAKEYGISQIVRICADNPFLDMSALKKLIELGSKSDYDYLSFCTSANLPTIKTHFGFWAEYTTLAALEKVACHTNDAFHHEHVTIYIYTHPNEFKIKLLQIDNTLESKTIRLTIDTLTDFQIQQDIFKDIFEKKPNFALLDVVDYLDKHPSLYEVMNREIDQNKK